MPARPPAINQVFFESRVSSVSIPRKPQKNRGNQWIARCQMSREKVRHVIRQESIGRSAANPQARSAQVVHPYDIVNPAG